MEFREGVFFGMSEEDYHSVPALSASGMKDLRTSPLTYWVKSPFNPNRDEVLAEESSSEARDLGKAFHKRILEGAWAFAAAYAVKLDESECDGALVTQDDLKAWLKEHDLKVSGSKAEQIARIQEADSSVPIFADLLAKHEALHDGKSFLSAKWMQKIEIAAAMIEKHPHLCKAFTGGAPEVSVFWTCPVIGVNCKARLDYLKARAIVDLKTLLPMSGTPLDRAVALEFGRRRYFIQAAFYAEAASKVADFLKRALCDELDEKLAIALAADHPKTFLFVFQVKGPAPVAIGRVFPAQSMIFQAAQAEIDTMKMLYKTCLDKYGPDVPWVDDGKIEQFSDEDVPPWALT